MSEEDLHIIKSKLRKKGLMIIDENYHPESFGSWYLIIEGQQKFRLVWDGKDPSIRVENLISNSSHLDQWKEIWHKINPTDKEINQAIDILGKYE